MSTINSSFDPDDLEYLLRELRKSVEGANANWNSQLKTQLENISKYMQSEEMMSIIEESNKRILESFKEINFKSLFDDFPDDASIESYMKILKEESVSNVLDEYLELAFHSYENDSDLGTLLALYPYIEGVVTEISKLCGAGPDELLYSKRLFDYVVNQLDEYDDKKSVNEIREYWAKGAIDGRNSICHGQIEEIPSSEMVYKVFGGAVMITEIYRRKLKNDKN